MGVSQISKNTFLTTLVGGEGLISPKSGKSSLIVLLFFQYNERHQNMSKRKIRDSGPTLRKKIIRCQSNWNPSFWEVGSKLRKNPCLRYAIKKNRESYEAQEKSFLLPFGKVNVFGDLKNLDFNWKNIIPNFHSPIKK